MTLRYSDSLTKTNLADRISSQRSRLGVLQERATSGKKILRPSDDPAGSAAVIRLRTSQAEIAQFEKSATFANQRLTAADTTLNGYESVLERVRVLTTQGLSDTASQTAKNNLATELETLKGKILNIANTRYGDDYLFGGTRLTGAPFDQTTAVANATPTTPQTIQVEPGESPLQVSVVAEDIFSDATSDIFTDITTAVTALRGTGDAAVDRTSLESAMTRLSIYNNQAIEARTKVGVNMDLSQIAQDRLTNSTLSLQEQRGDIEDADFAQTVLEMTKVQTALDATLQIAASSGRKSLFDYL